MTCDGAGDVPAKGKKNKERTPALVVLKKLTSIHDMTCDFFRVFLTSNPRLGKGMRMSAGRQKGTQTNETRQKNITCTHEEKRRRWETAQK